MKCTAERMCMCPPHINLEKASDLGKGGGGGPNKNSLNKTLLKRGMGIFWNYTIPVGFTHHNINNNVNNENQRSLVVVLN